MSLLILFNPSPGGAVPPTPEVVVTPAVVTQKYFVYKVFKATQSLWDVMSWDVDAWNETAEPALVGIWKNDVISEPSFRTTINGSDGEMLITLARPFGDYGEGIDIIMNNTVECYVYDKESPTGSLLYRGRIIGYAPIIDGETEYLEVRVRGFGSTLSDRILRDADGNTTITYTNVDPSVIFMDIVDKFIMYDDGQLGYTASEIDGAGTPVSYTFNTNTYREALETVVALSPAGFYFRVDPDGTIAYKKKPTTITHNFSATKDIFYLKPEKNIEDFFNEVYFIGGDTGAGENLYRRSRNVVSSDAYGVKIKKIVDGRTTDTATADSIASRFLAEKDTVTRKTEVKVIDSNGLSSNVSGFDIESIRVGETMQIAELTAAIPTPTKWDLFSWDVGVWGNIYTSEIVDAMQITSVTYNPDFVQIEATTRIPEISRRIEDVNTKFESTVLRDDPTAPTLVQ